MVVMDLEQLKQHSFRESEYEGFYTKEEVDDFFSKVIESYANLGAKCRNYANELRNTKSKLAGYTEQSDAISQALLVAQTAANSITAEAQKRADDILNDADERKETVLCDAKRIYDQTVNEASREAKATLDNAKETARNLISEATESAKQSIDSANAQAEKTISEANAFYSEKIAKAEKQAEEIIFKATGKAKSDLETLETNLTSKQAEYTVLCQKVSGFRSDVLSLYKAQFELINQISQYESAVPYAAAQPEASEADEDGFDFEESAADKDEINPDEETDELFVNDSNDSYDEQAASEDEEAFSDENSDDSSDFEVDLSAMTEEIHSDDNSGDSASDKGFRLNLDEFSE